jgi:hypothetical protein
VKISTLSLVNFSFLSHSTSLPPPPPATPLPPAHSLYSSFKIELCAPRYPDLSHFSKKKPVLPPRKTVTRFFCCEKKVLRNSCQLYTWSKPSRVCQHDGSRACFQYMLTDRPNRNWNDTVLETKILKNFRAEIMMQLYKPEKLSWDAKKIRNLQICRVIKHTSLLP